jgi:hypothetical protein
MSLETHLKDNVLYENSLLFNHSNILRYAEEINWDTFGCTLKPLSILKILKGLSHHKAGYKWYGRIDHTVFRRRTADGF